jgi:hypothetical protein
MSDVVTLEQVAALAAQLPLAEQKKLAERLLGETEKSTTDLAESRRRLWREIRGIVAYPMCGEDAQAWVSRTRGEADEQRELQWKHPR